MVRAVSLRLTSLAVEPGSRSRWSCLPLTDTETPARLQRIRSTAGGPAVETRLKRPTGLQDAPTEGSRGPFDLREPLHPSAKRMTVGPVRAVCLPVAWRCAPRRALRLSLDAPPRCFKSASTTDVCSRAPAAKTPSSETTRRAPWRNPAGVLLRDPPRNATSPPYVSRRTPDHLAVIRPPTAPCLTARRRLRAGRLSRVRFRAARGERSSLLDCFTLRRPNPLAPPGD
jgi:hypothetical protein